MALHMLTTVDNPFDPATQYDEWAAYDAMLGYHTPSYLDRVAVTSSELSEADQDLAIELAIDEIVREDVLGIYKKVVVNTVTNYPEDPALAMLGNE